MKKNQSFLLVVSILWLSLIQAACSDSNGAGTLQAGAAQGILGGVVPAEGSVAKYSTVAIGTFNKTKGRFSSFCTGVVISKNLVLTAAHCMETEAIQEGAGVPSVTLYFGGSYENYDKNLERVSTKWKVNDHYKPIYAEEVQMVVSAVGDVAVIKIDEGVPASAVPMKIGINHNLQKDEEITVAGWGLVHEARQAHGFVVGATEEEVTAAQQNEDGDVDIETDRLYESKIPFIAYWHRGTHMVFQQSEDSGVCRGDSGGPAYYNSQKYGYVVIGTVRGAHAMSYCSGLSEYTNLTHNITFIKKAAAELGGSPVQVVSLGVKK